MLSESIANEYDIAEYIFHTKIVDTSKQKAIIKRIFGGQKDKAVKKVVDIDDVSELLKSEIDVRLKNYKHIILVVHSMGGLIGKSYILKCLEEMVNHKCPVMISLSVPHRGSNWALYGRVVSNKQMFDLEPLSDFLDSLNERWEEAEGDLLPEVICIHGKHDGIVLQKSAAPKNLKNNVKIYSCDEDHTSISKPVDEKDLVYLMVVDILLNHINKIEIKNKLLIKELEDTTVYDSEDFVIKLIIADIHTNTIEDAKVLYYNAETVNRLYRDSDDDFAILKELYSKIRFEYRNLYVDFQNGLIKSSSELLNEVYKLIKREHNSLLKATLPYINHYHKKGMVHHLANKAEYGVWWSLGHVMEDIERARER